jgi:hypothetical protein
LRGRFTKWYCIASPIGYAKTSNLVEQLNRAFNREYTLRTLVSLNALFGHLMSAAHHYSVRAKQFRPMPRPTSDVIQRYKKLREESRLQVTSAYRNAVAFVVDDVAHSHEFRVTQTGFDRQRMLPSGENAMHVAESAIAEEGIETLDQPTVGWTVNVANATCGCHSIIKSGWCAHLIACHVHFNMRVEGLVLTRTKFMTKRKRRQRGGQQRQVGHALNTE